MPPHLSLGKRPDNACLAYDLKDRILALQVGQSVAYQYRPGKILRDLKAMWPNRIFYTRKNRSNGYFIILRIE